MPCSNSASLIPLSTSSVLHNGLDWGGATRPSTNSELFGCATCWGTENSSGPYMLGLIWFLLQLLAAFLSTARNWPSDGPLLFTISASVLFLEHREKNQILDLPVFFFSLQLSSAFLPLSDLLDSSRMLVTPIRLPSVMLLSWKKDPVDCK